MGCSIVCRFRSVAVPIAFWVAGCLPVAATAADAAQRISFNRDIRPILSENCFACHGPDGGNRQAGLRLDVADQAMAELESGMRAIVPENIEASELLARVISDDPDNQMPPPEAKIGRLSDEQIEILKQWIAQGAPYEPHWSFVPVAKPELPPAGPGRMVHRAGIQSIGSSGRSSRSEASAPSRRLTNPRSSAGPRSTSPACLPLLPRSRPSSPMPPQTPTKNCSTGFWPARVMGSEWRPTGWISPAIPTAMGSRSTASG